MPSPASPRARCPDPGWQGSCRMAERCIWLQQRSLLSKFYGDWSKPLSEQNQVEGRGNKRPVKVVRHGIQQRIKTFPTSWRRTSGMGIPLKKEEKLNGDMNVTSFYSAGKKHQSPAAVHSFAEGWQEQKSVARKYNCRKAFVDLLPVRCALFIELLSFLSFGMAHHGRPAMARK